MKKGYKLYKQYAGVKLIQNGFNSYETKKSCQLGKLIDSAKKELKCITWYEVIDVKTGIVNIIYKEV